MKEQFKEDIFDAALTEALKIAGEREWNAIPKLDWTPSTKLDQIIGRRALRLSIRTAMKKTVRFMARAMIAVLVLFGVSFSLLMTQPRVSAAVKYVLFESFATHNRYQFPGDGTGAEKFRQDLQPAWLPEGFQLRQAFYMENSVTFSYLSQLGDEEEIRLHYQIAMDGSLSVDHQHYGEPVKVEISSQQGDYYQSLNPSFPDVLVWSDYGYAFHLSATFQRLSAKEMRQIAESI